MICDQQIRRDRRDVQQLGRVSLGILGTAIAPIALLWPMIGYFQHGEELRLNTKALHFQQVELQRQVEETAHRVQVCRPAADVVRAASPELRGARMTAAGTKPTVSRVPVASA